MLLRHILLLPQAILLDWRCIWYEVFVSGNELLKDKRREFSMSDIDKRPHCDAFRILLRDCLKVNPRDSLVILYDEDFYPYQPSLVDVLAELPHYPTQIFLPRVCQERLADQAALAGEAMETSFSRTTCRRR